VYVVDGYTGMIKYNTSGLSPLAGGVRGQVSRLVDTLKHVNEIHKLEIQLQDDNYGNEIGHVVLAPIFWTG